MAFVGDTRDERDLSCITGFLIFDNFTPLVTGHCSLFFWWDKWDKWDKG